MRKSREGVREGVRSCSATAPAYPALRGRTGLFMLESGSTGNLCCRPEPPVAEDGPISAYACRAQGLAFDGSGEPESRCCTTRPDPSAVEPGLKPPIAQAASMSKAE
jgi:hypothetical protein